MECTLKLCRSATLAEFADDFRAWDPIPRHHHHGDAVGRQHAKNLFSGVGRIRRRQKIDCPEVISFWANEMRPATDGEHVRVAGRGFFSRRKIREKTSTRPTVRPPREEACATNNRLRKSCAQAAKDCAIRSVLCGVGDDGQPVDLPEASVSDLSRNFAKSDPRKFAAT